MPVRPGLEPLRVVRPVIPRSYPDWTELPGGDPALSAHHLALPGDWYRPVTIYEGQGDRDEG